MFGKLTEGKEIEGDTYNQERVWRPRSWLGLIFLMRSIRQSGGYDKSGGDNTEGVENRRRSCQQVEKRLGEI
jgi:hypothetical protein